MSLKNVLLILLFYHSTFLECIIFGFLIYNDSFYKILDIVCKKFFLVKNPCHNYWHCVIARVVSNLINTWGINTAFFIFEGCRLKRTILNKLCATPCWAAQDLRMKNWGKERLFLKLPGTKDGMSLGSFPVCKTRRKIRCWRRPLKTLLEGRISLYFLKKPLFLRKN